MFLFCYALVYPYFCPWKKAEEGRISMRQYNGNTGDDFDHYKVEVETTLLEWLLANLKGQSRTKVKATLQGGGVRVNGKRVTRHDYALRPGMRISIARHKQRYELRNRFVKIVYEDRWLVVVDKNVGILSMAGGHSSLNVKRVLDDYFHQSRQKCTAHVVHRLDRDTSGLMIYAKDLGVEQALESNWHETVYDRRYVALVSGEMEDDEGTVASWLKDNAAYITYSSPVDNGGKYAVTHFHTLARTVDHSLVEFRLETGRKNQIRVHTADMGHPVCGDIKYGNGDDPVGRLCLHAYVLCFIHPVTHERMEFETPIPSSFKKVMKR